MMTGMERDKGSPSGDLAVAVPAGTGEPRRFIEGATGVLQEGIGLDAEGGFTPARGVFAITDTDRGPAMRGDVFEHLAGPGDLWARPDDADIDGPRRFLLLDNEDAEPGKPGEQRCPGHRPEIDDKGRQSRRTRDEAAAPVTGGRLLAGTRALCHGSIFAAVR